MKKIILLFILFSLHSCNEKLGNSAQEFIDSYSFNSIISNSDKIVIRPKKQGENKISRSDSSFESIAVFESEKPKEIKDFGKLFENSEYSGYCCCPETNYLIDLYKNSKKISFYFVDTIQYKNEVRVFENSFQYSYLIKRDKWKLFLIKLKLKKNDIKTKTNEKQ